eukprot:scaffold327777_cov53-Tisochrysis_lutea.AAC.1
MVRAPEGCMERTPEVFSSSLGSMLMVGLVVLLDCIASLRSASNAGGLDEHAVQNEQRWQCVCSAQCK